jgi:hypothetical protein
MSVTIYKLTFPNGRAYIGQTSMPLANRIRLHKIRIHRDSHPVALAWREWGHPEVSVIAIVESHMADDCERRAIALVGSLNVQGNPKYKKTLTDETKKKISASQKGRVFSDEHRAKISAGLRRRAERERKAAGGILRHSAETRAKMAESQKRRRQREASHSPSDLIIR